MGQERVFLFLIFPALMVALMVGLYFLLAREMMAAPADLSPALGGNRHQSHAPPLDPLELVRELEAAGALERSASTGSTPSGAEQAATIYEKILQRNPESDRAWGGLGRCLNAKRDFRGALRALDQACRLSVVEAGYFSARAESRRALGDLRGAVTDFSDSLRLRPGDVIVTNTILMVAVEAEDLLLYERKMGDIAKSRDAHADATWVMGAAAREMRSGNFEGARTFVRQARESLAPEQLKALLNDPVFWDRRGKEFLASLD